MTLPDAPSIHLDAPITDTSVQNLCTMYLDYIGQLLTEAESHFGGQGGSTEARDAR